MERKIRIEICGEMGAGKTTLVNLLNSNGFGVLYDQFMINPFLNNYIENPEGKNLFESEICFALFHYNSVRNSNSLLSACDWSVYQDLSYAQVNLSEEEYQEFFHLYSYILKDIGYPDLIIYLRCPVEMLMKRIATRGREKDSWVTKEYLEKCVSMLEQSLKDAKNIVVIDTDKVDYSCSGNQQEAVIKIIWDAINNSIAHP